MKKVSKKILISSSLVLLTLVGVTLCIDYALFKPTKINSFIASKIYKTPANTAFTDENFYKCVVDAYNRENSTSIAYTESLTDEQLKSIKQLSCSGYNKSDEEKIANTKGLEKLIALTWLDVGNNQLTKLDVSKNTALTNLNVWDNQLTSIDVSKNTSLTKLAVRKNQLTKLDVSKNTALTNLNVWDNQLTELDVSKNTSLTELNVKYNQLTSIDVSQNTNLKYLYTNFNQLTELDVSKNTSLIGLNVENNQLKTLYLNGLSLKDLFVENNQLTSLDVSQNTNLKYLYAYGNKLTELDVTKNTLLFWLNVGNNQLTKLDVSQNTALTRLDVAGNQLTSLDLSQNTNLEDLNANVNQLTELDVSKNMALTALYVANNQLTTIDVSNNSKITSLYIDSNPFAENKAIYKNDTFNNINSVVKLPEGKTPTMTAVKQNNSVVEKVDTSNQGYYQYDLYFRHSMSGPYTVKLNLYVIEATSDKYDINAEEGYIYTKTDTAEETILSNISLNYGEASIENNKLLIKYDGELMKSFDIVNISSSKYDLTKEYIYDNDFNIDNVTSTNGIKELKDNKLLIKYNDELLQSYDIVSLSSEKYDLTKDYIFTEEELNLDLINTKNLIKEVVDNKLIIRYNDEIFESIDIVKIESNKYDLSKKYIYTGTSNLDLNDINIINGQKTIEDNKLLIKYNENLLKEYQVININFGEYKTYDGLLVLPEEITYEELTNNITTNGVTYKIFNDESEVTEGNINEGMIIKIYYGDEVIDEYEVTNEYLEFDESLNIDNEVNIIEKLQRNLKLKDFVSLIRTSGSIEVRNNNNELLSDDSIIGTGSKLKITLSKRTVEYTLSVRGDVTGNGQAKMADVMKIATHIIEGNVIEGDAFERAADITGDGKIKMNDVMKLATFIIDGGEL